MRKKLTAILCGGIINRELRYPYWSTCGSGKTINICEAYYYYYRKRTQERIMVTDDDYNSNFVLGREQDVWLVWSWNNLHNSTCYLVISSLIISGNLGGIVSFSSFKHTFCFRTLKYKYIINNAALPFNESLLHQRLNRNCESGYKFC